MSYEPYENTRDEIRDTKCQFENLKIRQFENTKYGLGDRKYICGAQVNRDKFAYV